VHENLDNLWQAWCNVHILTDLNDDHVKIISGVFQSLRAYKYALCHVSQHLQNYSVSFSIVHWLPKEIMYGHELIWLYLWYLCMLGFCGYV